MVWLKGRSILKPHNQMGGYAFQTHSHPGRHNQKARQSKNLMLLKGVWTAFWAESVQDALDLCVGGHSHRLVKWGILRSAIIQDVFFLHFILRIGRKPRGL